MKGLNVRQETTKRKQGNALEHWNGRGVFEQDTGHKSKNRQMGLYLTTRLCPAMEPASE
jgi:hypothetical protein